ncbi:MAG: hypothetical protein GWN77_12090, partial [Gammaproteobacteria bacterium]|nr:hypothetical protein [Gammaproteobacteria bacterium]
MICSFTAAALAVPSPIIDIYDANVFEGNAGTNTVDVRVTLSAPGDSTVTVDYATSDGTATAGVDYTADSGTLNFPVGTIEQVITVTVNGDADADDGETFLVTLTTPSNGTLDNDQATVTIKETSVLRVGTPEIYKRYFFSASGSSSVLGPNIAWGYEMALGDMDADGHLDIVTSDVNGKAYWTLFNNGDGTFREPRMSGGVDVSSGVVLGDLNNDTVLDYVFVDYSSTFHRVAVVLNDGTGLGSLSGSASYT